MSDASIRESERSAPATRVDSAHSQQSDLESMVASVKGVVQALSGQDAEAFAEQMERQATEIGSHLHSHQSELDVREANYHCRAAQLENEMRVRRLIVREQEQELADRELELNDRFKSQAEQPLMQAGNDVSDGPGKSHTDSHVVDERLNARERMLSQSESLLQQQVNDLEQSRRQLESRKNQVADESTAGKLQLEKKLRNNEKELARKRAQIEQRQAKLRQQQQALEKTHIDVSRLHRESLEMRLCTEQLWAELTGHADEPEITQRLANLRRRLADEYQLARQSVTREKSEITQLLTRLDERQSKLKTEREGLQRWMVRRQEELEQQAARLVARQQQLDRKESEQQLLEEHRDAERREFQSEIQRLMRQLRTANPHGRPKSHAQRCGSPNSVIAVQG